VGPLVAPSLSSYGLCASPATDHQIASNLEQSNRREHTYPFPLWRQTVTIVIPEYRRKVWPGRAHRQSMEKGSKEDPRPLSGNGKWSLFVFSKVTLVQSRSSRRGENTSYCALVLQEAHNPHRSEANFVREPGTTAQGTCRLSPCWCLYDVTAYVKHAGSCG
jgi:hypothetical protein